MLEILTGVHPGCIGRTRRLTLDDLSSPGQIVGQHIGRSSAAVLRILEAFRRERHIGEAEWRIGRGEPVPPESALRIEGVLGEQPPSVFGNQVHRLEDEVEHPLVDEIVEVDPYPAGLDPFAPAGDLPLESMRAHDVDPNKSMPERPGA